MAPTKIKAMCIVLASALFLCNKGECSPFGARRVLADPASAGAETVFDVTTFGAKPDGTGDSALAMIKAWNAACKSGAPAKLVVPAGKFVAGEVVFQGPCNTQTPIIVEIQGTIVSTSDLSAFTQGVWIAIENVNGIIVNGGGTIDGLGASAWQYNANGEMSGQLPVSLQLSKVENGVIQNLNLVNSKGFHSKVTWSSNITVSDLKITAPGDSPNTDGMHISSSQDVNVTNLNIATGDDCISVGEGNTNVAISQITCGPGHGLSIGSLGKRPMEKDVTGVTIKNCTLTGTTNGARIKTYHASPVMKCSGVIFEDIVMNDVKNPIIIDQHYNSQKASQPSKVQIEDVHFRNIRGTSVSAVAVNLDCSQAVPCQDIELADINLTPSTGVPSISSACINTKPTLAGTLTLGNQAGGCQQ